LHNSDEHLSAIMHLLK